MIDFVNKRRCLKELMALDFVLTELNLYLDSHPNDKNALKMHMSVSKQAESLRRKYNDMYGPLTAKDNMNADEWEWVKGPWPWENC